MQYRLIAALACLLASGLLGCEQQATTEPSTAPPRPAAPTNSATPTPEPVSPHVASAGGGKDEGAKGARTHRAARCGECHDKMYREWSESPHAQTSESELYRALRKTADASCDRCHEPLRALGASAELAQTEGVNCDVCHRMDRVTVRADHADAPLQASGSTKYGPRCDARSPYFHEAECSPIFVKSDFCAACHLLSVPDPNGALLPVHSEFADWSKGPYAARGKTCQSCHMLPGVRAELATGESERDGVPDHGFWGRAGALRGTALTAHAQARWKGDVLVVAVSVKNAGAGHFIPAGAPGRQIVLRVTSSSESGGEGAMEERVFERRLVDTEGNVGSLTTAARVQGDTRIAAQQTRHEVFELSTPGASAARVVLSRRTDPELARRLGVAAGPEQPILSITLPLRANDGARRTDSRRTALVP